MSEKDAWDKFEIIFKTTILGLIPLVITLGANTVAQSIKRGEIIQSAVSSLIEEGAERDIALVALDTAFLVDRDWLLQKHPDDDEVVRIIKILLDRIFEKTDVDIRELKVMLEVLNRRGSEVSREQSDRITVAQQSRATSGATGANVSTQQQKAQANSSEALSILQDAVETQPTSVSSECPAGIRLAFIQYGQESSRKVAEEIQGQLSSCGISAPGIEQVNGIEQNDIRYASSTDRQAAESLQAYIENYLLSTQQARSFASPINLTEAGYNSAVGQFEIWLQ